MTLFIMVFSMQVLIHTANVLIVFNIARCIANSICPVARKLESHCTSQILNEEQD